MYNPQHWRKRAEDSRRLAGQLDDPFAKKAMLEVALSYEQLAKGAEKKNNPSPTELLRFCR